MLKLKNLCLPFMLTLGCLSSAAFATPAKPSSVEQLVQLAQIHKTVQDSIQAMRPVFQQKSVQTIQTYTGHQTLTTQDLTASQQLTAVLQNMTAESLKNANIDEMIRNIYQQNFTEEEVQAYIRFLNTPEGHSITQKTPMIMSQIGQDVAKLTQKGSFSQQQQEKYKQQIQDILKPLPKQAKIK